MIYLERVASEIKTVGLYDLILQDVQKILGKNRVNENEILEVINTEPQILEEYKQTNVEYNLSNIHIKDIPSESIGENCSERVNTVNANLAHLREIEKYTLDFEQSSTLVIIFSIEFFVLFSVQYFIVLLNLKEWQWEIYGLFALSIVAAWQYAKKERQKFHDNNIIYEEKYVQTREMLNQLEADGCIKREDLIIKECEEHV